MTKQYIERGAVCEALDDVIKGYIADKTFQGNFAAGVLCDFRDTVLAKIPAADVVEVKHGSWTKKHDHILNQNYWSCSECKQWAYGESNYCPNCGAKMGGDSK